LLKNSQYPIALQMAWLGTYLAARGYIVAAVRLASRMADTP
jgi:hypothetical protein